MLPIFDPAVALRHRPQASVVSVPALTDLQEAHCCRLFIAGCRQSPDSFGKCLAGDRDGV